MMVLLSLTLEIDGADGNVIFFLFFFAPGRGGG